MQLTINIGKFSSKPIVIATSDAGSNPSNNTSIFYDYTNSTATTLILYTTVNTVATNIGLHVFIIGPA